MGTFYEWLTRQTVRPDEIGSFAKELIEDNFTIDVHDSLEGWLAYASRARDNEHASQLIHGAWDEYLVGS